MYAICINVMSIASLISKQPGYKAVRRRKHQSQTTKANLDWNTQGELQKRCHFIVKSKYNLFDISN